MPRDRLRHLVALVNADYGGTAGGFSALHADIKAQFNVLADALPTMLHIGV